MKLSSHKDQINIKIAITRATTPKVQIMLAVMVILGLNVAKKVLISQKNLNMM